jgi:predicted HicB family RNase H-like nuclease
LDELPDDERIPFPEISPEPLATLYLLLPPTLKDRIVATAKKAGVALNEWVVRCLERGTGQSE